MHLLSGFKVLFYLLLFVLGILYLFQDFLDIKSLKIGIWTDIALSFMNKAVYINKCR